MSLERPRIESLAEQNHLFAARHFVQRGSDRCEIAQLPLHILALRLIHRVLRLQRDFLQVLLRHRRFVFRGRAFPFLVAGTPSRHRGHIPVIDSEEQRIAGHMKLRSTERIDCLLSELPVG